MAIHQTTTTKFPPIGQEGQKLSHPAEDVKSKIVDETNGIKPGRVVVPGTDPVREVSLPTALAADPDFLVTTDAALGAAAGTSFSGAGFTGAYTAGDAIDPPRNVTLTLGNDANWDATTATVVGLDEEGHRIIEELAIPNGGNATVAGQRFFSYIESVTIPAQTGDAPGSIGLGTEAGPMASAGIALLDIAGQSNVFVGLTAETVEPFADDDSVAVMYRGRCFVLSEDAATAGGLVYARLVTAGAEELGAVRASADGTSGAPDAVPLKGWRFRTSTSSANQLVEIERL